jgi:radical SAM-linked protein
VRIRFRFAKLGKLRFTGQRDVARMWERAFRRAGLPLAYTEGFSPRPQLSFGLALPTGAESLAEYLDVVLDDARPETAAVDPVALPALLRPLLPEGIVIEEAVATEGRVGSLQEHVTSCSWTMRLAGISREEAGRLVGGLLAAEHVPIERERKGRRVTDDLRPSVLALALADAEDDRAADPSGRTVGIVAELATQPRGVRPAELVTGLASLAATDVGGNGDAAAAGADGVAPDRTGGIPVLDRACRTHQWIERDGLREEPLRRRDDPAGRATYALRRAS